MRRVQKIIFTVSFLLIASSSTAMITPDPNCLDSLLKKHLESPSIRKELIKVEEEITKSSKSYISKLKKETQEEGFCFDPLAKKVDKNNINDTETFNFVTKFQLKIDQLNQSFRKKLRFLTLENSILKNLNDHIFGSKLLADEVNDTFKRIFYNKLISNPKLKEAMVGKFNDYKGLKFAFDESKYPGLTKELQKLLKETNIKFVALLKKTGIWKEFIKNGEDIRGIAASPKNWLQAGLSDESVDASGIFARIGRKKFKKGGQNPVTLYNHMNPDHIAAIEKELNNAEKARTKLVKFFKKFDKGDPSPIIQIENSTDYIPSAELLEIFRKGAPKNIIGSEAYFKYMKHRIETRFPKVKFSKDFETYREEIKTIREFFESSDTFSPGVISTKRVFHNIHLADDMVLSFDIVGLGSWNAEATARALALSKGKNFSETLVELRKQEKLVTVNLKKINSLVENSFREVFNIPASKIKKLVSASGDDNIVKLTKKIRDKIIQDSKLKWGKEAGRSMGEKEYLDKIADVSKILGDKLEAEGFTRGRIRPTASGRNRWNRLVPRDEIEPQYMELEIIEKGIKGVIEQRIGYKRSMDITIFLRSVVGRDGRKSFKAVVIRGKNQTLDTLPIQEKYQFDNKEKNYIREIILDIAIKNNYKIHLNKSIDIN